MDHVVYITWLGIHGIVAYYLILGNRIITCTAELWHAELFARVSNPHHPASATLWRRFSPGAWSEQVIICLMRESTKLAWRHALIKSTCTCMSAIEAKRNLHIWSCLLWKYTRTITLQDGALISWQQTTLYYNTLCNMMSKSYEYTYTVSIRGRESPVAIMKKHIPGWTFLVRG